MDQEEYEKRCLKMIDVSVNINDRAFEVAMKKLKNPARFFEPTVKKETSQLLSYLIRKTPRRRSKKGADMRGSTAQKWTFYKKDVSHYIIFNDALSADGKHLIVEILDKGRGEVLPIRAKVLYIPLIGETRVTSSASIKKITSKESPYKFGKDYIFTKKARAYKGTGFFTKEIKNSEKRFLRAIMHRIDTI